MSANLSTSSNSSHHPPIYCIDTEASISISAFIGTKNSLLPPLSILVLYLGHRRWRKQRSFATTSHSDIFTYHLATVELLGALGSLFYFCGLVSKLPRMIEVGLCLYSITFPGEVFFHILTCVERYLAVVHPITYLGLKKGGGIRLRNIIIVCSWLIFIGWMGFTASTLDNISFIPMVFLFIVSLIVVSFCSLRVLCVLIRPGPGEGSGDKERLDQSKQRALHTVMAIMGMLWLWLVGCLVCFAVNASSLLSYREGCLVLMSGLWFNLPSSLVLPLLFLHRAGLRLKYNTNLTHRFQSHQSG